jgi:predicted dehydrogenase
MQVHPPKPPWQDRVGRAMRKRLDRFRGTFLDRIDAFAGPGPEYKAQQGVASSRTTGIGIVGCGFVADFYAANLRLHPELRLIGCTDVDETRVRAFARRNACAAFSSLEDLLEDGTIEIVVNLTSPASHAAVTRASLEAGKHVYSEKPLAHDYVTGRELTELAESRGLVLASAPCSVLGEAATAMRTAVRRGDIGTIRIAYAELDDGPIHLMHPESWVSPAGTHWPWRDEFMVGCTVEHAGYHLSWLVALFGSVTRVIAFSRTLIPDKHPDLPSELCAPDFSVAVLLFECGVVARLTCSIVAPHDQSIRLIGEAGVLEVDEVWHFGAPLTIRATTGFERRAASYQWINRHGWTRRLFGTNAHKSDLSPRVALRRRVRRHEMDYALGPAEVAAAVREGRKCRLSAALGLHLTEITHAIACAGEEGTTTEIISRCAPL